MKAAIRPQDGPSTSALKQASKIANRESNQQASVLLCGKRRHHRLVHMKNRYG